MVTRPKAERRAVAPTPARLVQRPQAAPTPLRPVGPVVPVAALPLTIEELQRRTLGEPDPSEDMVPVRLVLGGGPDVVVYHCLLQLSVLIGILDTRVPDGFIRIQPESTSVHQPIGGKHRFIHTMQIAQVAFDRDLPDGAFGEEN